MDSKNKLRIRPETPIHGLSSRRWPHRAVRSPGETGPPRLPLALLVAYGPSPAAPTTDTTASTTAAADRTLFGFTPFPTHEGIKGVVSCYEIVIDRGDLMTHHFDTCIR